MASVQSKDHAECEWFEWFERIAGRSRLPTTKLVRHGRVLLQPMPG